MSDAARVVLREKCLACPRIFMIEYVPTLPEDADAAELAMKDAILRHQYHAHMDRQRREVVDLIEQKYGEPATA